MADPEMVDLIRGRSVNEIIGIKFRLRGQLISSASARGTLLRTVCRQLYERKNRHGISGAYREARPRWRMSRVAPELARYVCGAGDEIIANV
jgi:hypothetical protein